MFLNVIKEIFIFYVLNNCYLCFKSLVNNDGTKAEVELE